MAESLPEPTNVSIVVPVRNSARTVRDLLESLMKLDYDKERTEIIFVDGRSTDGTRKIVEEYPVRLIDEEGRGLNAARNTGIKYSKGEIIAYTDGDCVVPPDWASAIVKNFRDPKISFVGGLVKGYDRTDFISVYMDETFFQVKPGFRWRRVGTDLELLQFPAGCNMAFRRHALEKINLFDERIDYGFDDLDPVEMLGRRGFSIVLDPDVWVYHQHRTDLKELLKQHYNYGRGGALLVIHKRSSKLGMWYSTYLITTTLGIGILATLVLSAIYVRHLLPVNLALWIIGLFLLMLTTLSIEPAVRSRSLRKLIIYPLLDIVRGFFFTMGGLVEIIHILFGDRRLAQNP